MKSERLGHFRSYNLINTPSVETILKVSFLTDHIFRILVAPLPNLPVGTTRVDHLDPQDHFSDRQESPVNRQEIAPSFLHHKLSKSIPETSTDTCNER